VAIGWAMTLIIPIILCGGSGTRLWPKSRAVKPKPFLPLVGETTLFEATLARCAPFDPPVVVTGAAHLAHVEAQLGAAPGASIIVEPEAKNTAAAIALAALRLPDEAVMLVCPSDHHIGDVAAFAAAARTAASLAEQGWLVSFGIEATSPETGFGYLKRGEAIGAQGFKVAQFVEKPDLERAKAFIADGQHAWNGGIFAFKVKDFLDELEEFHPAISLAVVKSVRDGHEAGRCLYPQAEAFAAIKGLSVDYAVMEKTKRAAMVPADMAWSDIGNWQALHDARAKDAAGNSVVGKADLVDCRNVLIESDGPRVSAIGLDGVIIVVNGDEVLVTTPDGAQLVGKLSGAANQ
jgi:mannose-1-phosphate guanylyltransferase